MPPIEEIYALLPPALTGLAIVIAGAWWARRGGDRILAGAAVLAIAVAYCWTFVRERGMPAMPPRQSVERGFFAVGVAAVLAVVLAVTRRGAWVRVPILAASAVAAVLLVAGGWAPKAIAPLPLFCVAAGAIAYFVLMDLASYCPTPVFCASVAAGLGASGQVFFLFGSALLAQLAGVVSILMGAIAVACFFFRRQLPAAAAVPLAAIAVALSLDAALFLYEPPPAIALVLLAAAPLAPILPQLRFSRRLGPVTMLMVGFASALVVTGAGFYLAWRVAPEPYG